MKRIVLIFLVLILSSPLYSEQTIGLFYNTPQSYDGYTLIGPSTNDTTYLIDNCGEKVHTWVTNTIPGNTVYLLDNGILLRTGMAKNEKFKGGGSGGIIQMLDWDSKLIWEYTLSDSTQCHHHDIEPLPNGNILILAWSLHTKEEALQAGRTISPVEFWSEKVVEVKPDLVNGGGEVVWEWGTWDHLVQDVSDQLDNYGDVSNPRKINFNYSTKGFSNVDWLHFNSVDYNPKLDQIMLSNHNFGEILIIDHSTTTAEAKTDKGGKSGYGGGLLYRWGNPMSYGQGTKEDIKLFVQHDAHWIPDSLSDGGKILVFNNNIGSLEGLNYSEVVMIEPEVDEKGNYILNEGKFGPSEAYWNYRGTPDTSFYSRNYSSSQRLPNGNTLICEGAVGRLTEINPIKEKVWQYVVPTGMDGILLHQGEIPLSNNVFRAERFSKRHPAFIGRDLEQKGYIELGSEFTCDLYVPSTVKFEDNLNIVVNQYSDRVVLESKEIINQVEIFNSIGAKIYDTKTAIQTNTISTNNLGTGVYFIKIYLNNQIAYRKIMIN